MCYGDDHPPRARRTTAAWQRESRGGGTSRTRQRQLVHAFAQSQDEDNGGGRRLVGRQSLFQLNRQTRAGADMAPADTVTVRMVTADACDLLLGMGLPYLLGYTAVTDSEQHLLMLLWGMEQRDSSRGS